MNFGGRLDLTGWSTIVVGVGRTSDAKERLMDATLALMWEESYGAVTIDDICRRAGVKKGSFYYFFDGKASLAVEALERAWTQEKAWWDETFSASLPPLERIWQACAATFARQQVLRKKHGKVLGCPLGALGSEVCTQDDAIRDQVRAIFGRKLRYWESALREAQATGQVEKGDVREKAACAMAFFQGMIGQARMLNDIELLRDLPERMLEHLRVRDGVVARG